MRFGRLSFSIAVVAASALLGACGGHGALLPNHSSPQRVPLGSNLVLQGTINGSGPQLFANRRYVLGRHTLATFSVLKVTGTLFEGDTGDIMLRNAITETCPCGPTFSASIPFSNVTTGNNLWAIMEFDGQAADGSTITLGDLGGLLNVTSSTTNTSTLSETTTKTLQVALNMLFQGDLSTFDLASSTLNSTLNADITATGIAVDPTTHVFTPGALATVTTDLTKKFERDAMITASPATNGSLFILRDYTIPVELNLASELQTFSSTFTVPTFGTSGSSSNIIGGPSCGGFIVGVPPHSPSTAPAPVPFEVNSCILTAPTAATSVRSVYGGHIMIGATNNPFTFGGLPPIPPFNGGFKSVAGEAPGSFSVTVPTALMEESVKVNDPAGFAFGLQFFASSSGGAFSVVPNFGNAPLSGTLFTTNVFGLPCCRVMAPTPYNASSNTVTVEILNPWFITKSNMDICGGIVSCFDLAAAQPFTIQRPFADAGTNLGFFNYKPGGTASSIVQLTPNPPGGYKVTVTGAGTATLMTTTPSLLIPRQTITISGVSLPTGTWTITAHDAASNTFTNSGTVSFGSITFHMDAVEDPVSTKDIGISLTTAGAGSFTISGIH